MNFLQQISVATRLKDWRFSFVPFIIGCVYLWLWWFKVQFSVHGLLLVLCSLTTTAGFAALGYLINELFDIKDDLRAGKANKLAMLPIPHIVLLFFVALLLTFLPWVYLPFDKVSVALIVSEISAFLLYSLPFPRFKKVPGVSNLLDAAYAYLLPLILSFYTFRLEANSMAETDFILIGLLSAMVFWVGIRNIIIHQVDDVFRDKLSGIYTLPMFIGVGKTNGLIAICIGLEVVFTLMWILWMTFNNSVFYLWLIVYSLIITRAIIVLRYKFQFEYLSINKGRHLADHAQQIYFPIAMLMFLILIEFRWILIFPFHLAILIPSFVFVFIRGYIVTLRHNGEKYIKYPATVVVNYSIYYLFLSFDVDLKLRKQTAFQALRMCFKKLLRR